jgi:hypothetical protein
MKYGAIEMACRSRLGLFCDHPAAARDRRGWLLGVRNREIQTAINAGSIATAYWHHTRNDQNRNVKLARIVLTRAALLSICCVASAGPAWSQSTIPETTTTYGDLGILEMPSARMAADGQMAINIAIRPDAQRYSLSFQALPWLEGSFRYSHIPGYGRQQDYYDRSFGMKVRLFQEYQYWPDISLGIRDILGTGIYGSEYLVASKHIWQFDLTGGLGWGRLAQQAAFANPLGELFPSFYSRLPPGGTLGTGAVDFNQFFHGKSVGFFGGIVWVTPIDGLDALVEYSTDRYQIEHVYNAGPKIRSQLNEGLDYHILPNVTIGAGWYYGSTWGAMLSFDLDPTTPPANRFGPALPNPIVRSDQEQSQALMLLVDQNGALSHSATSLVRPKKPTASQLTSVDVIAALVSEGGGVRQAEIDGSTLLVNAQHLNENEAQCERYGQIADAAGATISTVALTDFDDPEGRVTICSPQTLTLASMVQPSDARDAADPSSQVEVSRATPETATPKLLADISAQSITVFALSLSGSELWLYYENARYLNETEAAGRIARVLMADAPADVEIFHLISVKNGLAMREVQIARSALERFQSSGVGANELGAAISVSLPPLDNPLLDGATRAIYPAFHWSVAPALRESAFDPNAPFQIQALVTVAGSVDILPGLSIAGEFDRNLYNDFQAHPSNSVLPHVRSDIGLYLKDGINAIGELALDYHTRLASDIYGEFEAGYLEMMFAGAGGQILWRPDGSRLSFGADLYEVRRRGFDQLFDIQPYHILTGHVTAYYESPYYGLNFAVHVGRYLAGDYGATFEITRRFSTGVEVGAFATFTNVPFATFGEGSFDKGIIIRIPLEWALPFYSQSMFNDTLRSLARDGGQRLDNDDSLFEETRPTSDGEVSASLDDITSP